MRILLILSITDEWSIAREGFIRQQSKDKAEVRFWYAYAVEEVEDLPQWPRLHYSELLKELDTEVTEFAPDVLIIHTGSAFQRNPAAFLQVLAVLKYRYPHLKFIHERMHSHVDFEQEDKPIHGMISVIDIPSFLITHNELFDGSIDNLEAVDQWPGM